jgi:hypothetical protein
MKPTTSAVKARKVPPVESRCIEPDTVMEGRGCGQDQQWPPGQPRSPSCYAAPYAEREYTCQDDHLDDPRERDTSDGEYHQDDERRDGDEQKSALLGEDCAVLWRVSGRPRATRDPSAAPKTWLRKMARIGPTMTITTFQKRSCSQPS